MDNTTTTEAKKSGRKFTEVGHAGDTVFFLVGGEVYRGRRGAPLDIHGIPMGMRWECSIAHWNRYRDSAFSWVSSPA